MAPAPQDKTNNRRNNFIQMLSGEVWQILVKQGDDYIVSNSSNSAMESMLEAARTTQRSIPSAEEVAECKPSYDELLHWLYVDAYLRHIEPDRESVASADVDAAWVVKLTKWRTFRKANPLPTIREHLSSDDLACSVVEMCTDIREIYRSTL
jgi:hypothetical protein